jgi:hypothetical protein
MEIDHSGPYPCYRVEQEPAETLPIRCIARMFHWFSDLVEIENIWLVPVVLFFSGMGFKVVAGKSTGDIAVILYFLDTLCSTLFILALCLPLLLLVLGLCLAGLHKITLLARRVSGRHRDTWELEIHIRPLEIEIYGRPKESPRQDSRCFALLHQPGTGHPIAIDPQLTKESPYWNLELRPEDGPPCIFPELSLSIEEIMVLREVLENATRRALELHGQGEAEVPEEIRQFQQKDPAG